MRIMTDEQAKQISNDLYNFVHRGLTGQSKSPEELGILPEMAKILFSQISVLHVVDKSGNAVNLLKGVVDGIVTGVEESRSRKIGISEDVISHLKDDYVSSIHDTVSKLKERPPERQ